MKSLNEISEQLVEWWGTISGVATPTASERNVVRAAAREVTARVTVNVAGQVVYPPGVQVRLGADAFKLLGRDLAMASRHLEGRISERLTRHGSAVVSLRVEIVPDFTITDSGFAIVVFGYAEDRRTVIIDENTPLTPTGAIPALASQTRWYLVAETGTRLEVTDNPVVLGRSVTGAGQVDDHLVSSTHASARLTRDGTAVRISDLGSTNGTWVGRNRITDHIARAGTTIRIGRTYLQVTADSVAVPPPFRGVPTVLLDDTTAPRTEAMTDTSTPDVVDIRSRRGRFGDMNVPTEPAEGDPSTTHSAAPSSPTPRGDGGAPNQPDPAVAAAADITALLHAYEQFVAEVPPGVAQSMAWVAAHTTATRRSLDFARRVRNEVAHPAGDNDLDRVEGALHILGSATSELRSQTVASGF